MAIRLHIRIIQAEGIFKSSSMVGSYVTIGLKSNDLKDCLRTHVIKNNSRPLWNQEFNIIVMDPNDVLLINMYDGDIKHDDKIMEELQYPISTFSNGQCILKNQKIQLKKNNTGTLIFEVQAFKESIEPNACLIKIFAFDANKLLKMDTDGKSDPYLKFRLKGQNKVVRSQVISNSLNPIWRQQLELTSTDRNNDILLVDLFDEDIREDDKMMDTIKIPLRDHAIGSTYDFNNDIKFHNKKAGHLHFSLSFIATNDSSSPVYQSKEVKMSPNIDSKPKINEIEDENTRLKKLQEQQEQQIKELKEQQEQKIKQRESEKEQIIKKLEKENKELRSKLEKNNSNNKVEQTGSKENKLKIADSIWLYQNKSKNIENSFVGEDEEKFHKYIEKVGEGATSITYKIIDTRTNMIMCKKVLKVDPKNPPSMKDVQNIIKEFEVLNQINHPCICTAFYINTQETVKDANIDDSENTTIAIFLEFLENDLKKLLPKSLNNTLKTRIIVEISHALNYLHKRGMIHRDLKIENIMLNSVYQAKLVDFGLIRIHECLPEYSYVAESMTKGVGTFVYMSPEMLNEESYDYKTDVYSFGVVLYYMFTGSLPKLTLKDKMKGKKISVTDKSNGITDFCIKLIEKCTAGEPDERPTFEEILEELRSNEYSLINSIDKSAIHQRDMELCLFEDQ